MSYQVSRLDVADGVAEFTLLRGEKRNPLVPELTADLYRMLHEMETREDIASLIVYGGPGAFCAGGNMAQLKEGFATAAEARRHMREVNGWSERIHRLPIPVIMAVDGAAFGGGFSLALTGDFIFATPRASFSAVFGRIGLVPDLGAMYYLPRMVGLQNAKDMVYTARKVEAEEAKAMGLVHSIHAPDDLMPAARRFARRFVHGSRTAFDVAKGCLNESLHIDFRAVQEMEISGQPICLKSDYHRAAVGRFLAKEPATFDWDRLVAEDKS
ncbi:enoyl-CoA hydratase/isomerase family protein [Ramlibacter sp.]|uniref:enoyl-CoA hydratase/isomerase family protein n=1 Tax=Ramlibacter sp. TaxID=1917967 RepID=UPI003D1406BA